MERLTVVVPLFNEADSIERLAGELARLRRVLTPRYAADFLLVDDGSQDATWNLLQRWFGNDEQVRLVRHASNRGLAAAISTGITEARTPLVASIDADCTYDPSQLLSLLERCVDGVDMVVASPYHPQGMVAGVAPWRVAISRLASWMYGLVLRNQLHTYTSCFRVYRRSSVFGLPVSRTGFVGIVELLWQLDRRGGTIVECPAVLTSRKTGQSKMRIIRTAIAHLGLLMSAAWQRWAAPRHRARHGAFVPRPIGNTP